MATKNKDGSEKSLKQLLFEGLTDFIGFAGGAFLCYWLGIVGVVVMLIGGGAGLKLGRHLR